MSKCKVSFIGALMLVLTGTTAGAADLGDDYRGSLKDDVYEGVSDNNRGWYLRGDIGIGLNQAPSIEDDLKSDLVGEDWGNNWSLGGGIGYNIMRGFRIDATLDYRFGSDVDGYFPGSPTTPMKGELSSLVGLVNLYYDLDMGHRITPYVGVGIGFARHTMDGNGTVGGADVVDFDDETDTNFAWALMAGVDVDLRSNWKLDIGYRYLNMGEGQFDKLKPIVGKTFILDDLESHEIRVGLRYQFGCLRDCSPSYESYK